jgi:alpha-tubulin suppressor-like RCC1 family protein
VSGQLGDGTTINASTPVAIASPSGVFIGLFTGGMHSCGLAYSGVAYCWGDNLRGQLGDGTTSNSSTAVAVVMPAGETFASLSLGLYHSCGLTPDGRAYCWGDNWSGKLGDGTTMQRLTPVPVIQ